MGGQVLSTGTGTSPGDPGNVTRGRKPPVRPHLARLTANLRSLSFASVQVGNSRTLSEALTNTGRSDVTISKDAVSGAGFSVSDFSPPITLKPWQTYTFSVIFAPQSAQSASGSISFVSNASNSKLTIPLSGTGTVPSPGVLTANLSSLSFASVQVGDSRTLSETLTNTGRTDVTISQDVVSGTGFRVSDFSPPVSLTPGQTLTFSLIFAPESAQRASGSISLASNASNSNLTIPLSGTGIAVGQLAVNPTNLNFGRVVAGTSVSLQASLSATGSSVIVNSASLSAADFTLSGQSFPLTIASGQSVPLRVTFKPRSSGVANATLSFASNTSSSTTVSSLTGTGTAATVSYHSARTDLTFQPYPNPIPCPSESGCPGGGALTGANYQLTPSDFPSTPIVRITDVNTVGTQHSYNTSCDASSEVNDWSMNDDRFTICQNGNRQLLFSFDTATNTATQDPTFVSPGTGSLYFSYTQPYIMYHAHLNGSNDLAIFSYDTTSLGNPTAVQVVDLGTACSIAGLIGNSSAAATQGITVSGDDQTFGVAGSSTDGQGSSGDYYAIAWNRTTGCTYWNTRTGHIFVNGVDQGAIGISDTFLMHNLRIGKSGTWMKVQISSCLGACTSGAWNYLWEIGTTAITVSTSGNGCGHTAVGYSHWVNKCDGTEDVNGLFMSPFTSPNTQISLPASYPSPDQSNGAHLSWADDNDTDSAPFFAMMQGPSFAGATGAWTNELLGVSTNGSGLVYRLAHTYATTAMTFTPGAISQDGKYLLWTTDWDGMLGNTNGTDVACTIGINCRADVFMAILPIIQ
jgi:hypothetical protein